MDDITAEAWAGVTARHPELADYEEYFYELAEAKGDFHFCTDDRHAEATISRLEGGLVGELEAEQFECFFGEAERVGKLLAEQARQEYGTPERVDWSQVPEATDFVNGIPW